MKSMDVSTEQKVKWETTILSAPPKVISKCANKKKKLQTKTGTRRGGGIFSLPRAILVRYTRGWFNLTPYAYNLTIRVVVRSTECDMALDSNVPLRRCRAELGSYWNVWEKKWLCSYLFGVESFFLCMVSRTCI